MAILTYRISVICCFGARCEHIFIYWSVGVTRRGVPSGMEPCIVFVNSWDVSGAI